MSTPKNVFVSMPMRNRSESEIQAEFSRIRKKIENIILIDSGETWYGGFRVLNSLFNNIPNDSSVVHTPVKMLGMAIEILSTADYAFFASGWENAGGCTIEHKICKDYGIPIIEERRLNEAAQDSYMVESTLLSQAPYFGNIVGV